MAYFGTAEGAIGPLEAIFRQLGFKPLVFGTFAESRTIVREFIDTAVEYGVEHMGRTVAATTVDAVRLALKRRPPRRICPFPLPRSKAQSHFQFFYPIIKP